jgi:RNA polymerase sigma factor (sigma-70 family)
MKNISQIELVALMESEDEDQNNIALEYIYMRFYKSLEKKVRSYNLDPEITLDVFQEVMIVLVREIKIKKSREMSNLYGFIAAVIRNQILLEVRRQNRHSSHIKKYKHESQNDSIFVQEDPIHHEGMAFYKIINSLGEECKKLLTMFYLDRKNIDQIAKEFNIANQQSVRNKKLRCMNKLREYINASGYNYHDLIQL